jgi:cell division protease FtsH
MVTRYGMSQTLGLATIEGSRLPLFLNTDAPQTVECSEETSRMIDHEVRQMLDEAKERVHRDLTTSRATLDALAALLIEHEVVDRRALDGLMPKDRLTAPQLPTADAPVAG